MRLLLCIIVIVLLGVSAPALDAVGQEKVTMVSGFPISIQYSEGDEKVARKVSSVTADALPRLTRELGLDQIAPFRILLIADMPAFKRESDVRLPEWGVAFAFMENQVMLVDVKRATHAMNRLERVVPHELSHLLVAQRVGDVAMPRWFVEGLAMWQAREWSLLEHWRLMEAVWGNRAPSLGRIYSTLPAEESKARDAYRVSYVGFTDRFDDRMELIPSFLDEVARSGDFAGAFEGFWQESEADYYQRFALELTNKYRTRLLLFQTGPLFTIMAVVFIFVVLRIYIRNRIKLKKMEDLDGDAWPRESP